MACGSCSTKKDKNGVPMGCQSNGSCASSGCNKLTVFDWLSNMELPTHIAPFLGVEVRFKNSRKLFFKNTKSLSLRMGDVVVTRAETGCDVGVVTLTGELVKVQMKRKKAKIDHPNTRDILRKATEEDVSLWQDLRAKEDKIQIKAREIALKLGLSMKISDVEFQADGSKAVFYYTAEERVDFRQLIKDLAYEFKIRIEMRQIGLRQEASRIGGIGSCGRELCCSTWLTDFRAVNTSAARYQQLSINPQKLVGQCGKLKCCLNFELDTYMDILKDFPKSEIKLYTKKGTAVCQKVDIFGGYLWYTYEGDWMNWHKISKESAKEIIACNKKDQKGEPLENYVVSTPSNTEKDTAVSMNIDLSFKNGVGQDSITRFDKKTPKQKRNSSSKNTYSKGAKSNSSYKKRPSNPKSKNQQESQENARNPSKNTHSNKSKNTQKNTKNARNNSPSQHAKKTHNNSSNNTVSKQRQNNRNTKSSNARETPSKKPSVSTNSKNAKEM